MDGFSLFHRRANNNAEENGIGVHSVPLWVLFHSKCDSNWGFRTEQANN